MKKLRIQVTLDGTVSEIEADELLFELDNGTTVQVSAEYAPDGWLALTSGTRSRRSEHFLLKPGAANLLLLTVEPRPSAGDAPGR